MVRGAPKPASSKKIMTRAIVLEKIAGRMIAGFFIAMILLND
jgi:hypothetical protein